MVGYRDAHASKNHGFYFSYIQVASTNFIVAIVKKIDFYMLCYKKKPGYVTYVKIFIYLNIAIVSLIFYVGN